MTGASAPQTGLGSAEAQEPFGLRPTGAIPCAFTPGPWWVHDRRDTSGFLQVQAKHRGEGSSYCVASVNYWEAPEANACLIAAAPELCAALERLEWSGFREVRWYDGGGQKYACCPACRGLEKPSDDFRRSEVGHREDCGVFIALAKARGEQVPE